MDSRTFVVDHHTVEVVAALKPKDERRPGVTWVGSLGRLWPAF